MDKSAKFFPVVNGVRLCSVQTSRFKTGRISVNMAVPLTNENVAANGVLPYLMHRSCAKYPNFSMVNGRLAELYGARLSADVEKIGEVQLLRMCIDAIDDRFALSQESILNNCMQLLCEFLFHPDVEGGAFEDKDVNLEKRLMTERIDSELNDKRAYALRRCEAVMCENEKYGVSRYGTKEQVNALTSEQLYKAWKEVLRSAKIQVNIIGSANPETALELLKKEFDMIGRTGSEALETEIVAKADTVRRVEEKLPIKQGKLVIGMRAGYEEMPKNIAAEMVTVDLFGGGPYSKLFMNVREKMSLCYYCSARLYRQKGIVMVQSGIEQENAEKAEKAILEQLKAVCDGDFTDSDLEASLMGLSDSFDTVEDTPEGIDSWYGFRMLDETPLTPQETAENIRRVTREDVCEAAKKITVDTVYLLSGDGTAQEGEEADE